MKFVLAGEEFGLMRKLRRLLGRSMRDFVVQYDDPGAVNGGPVGTVYAKGVLWDDNGFSYTHDLEEATGWPTREAAEAEASRRYWPGARVLARDTS